MKRKSLTSYILPEDEQTAIDLIKDSLGEVPNVIGTEMAVKLYILGDNIKAIKREDGTEIKIAIPDSVRLREIFKTVIALVIAQGPECYKGEKYDKSGPLCRIGDWIMIPRNEGKQVIYKGIPMHIIDCDKIYGVVKDPDFVYRKK